MNENLQILLPTQEVTIKSWQPWMDQETNTPVTDNHGNPKGTATFEEYSAQPVDATFKAPVEVGQKKYGQVGEYKTKAGKIRIGFTRKDRPKEDFHKSNWQPRDDVSIRAQFAIKTAANVCGNPPHTEAIIKDPMALDVYFSNVEHFAKEFFAMVERVKAGDQGLKAPSQDPGEQTATTTTQNNPDWAPPGVRQRMNRARAEKDEDNEITDDMRNLMEQEPQT